MSERRATALAIGGTGRQGMADPLAAAGGELEVTGAPGTGRLCVDRPEEAVA